MKEKQLIQNTFQGWKIWLGIFIGLSVVIALFFKSFREEKFIPATKGDGTFVWKDINGNNAVDNSMPEEFIYQVGGNYKKERFSDILQSVKWDIFSVFWLCFAIIFAIGRDLFYVLRIRYLTDNKLSNRSGWNVILLWEFASALAPGVMSGSAVAMFILNKENISLGRSTAVVIVTILLDNLFYLISIPLFYIFLESGAFFPAGTAGSSSIEFIFWMAYSLFSALCLVFGFFVFYKPMVFRKIIRFIVSLPLLGRLKSSGERTAEDLELASKEFKGRRFFYWLKAFFFTVSSWSCRFLVINALLNAFLTLSAKENILIYGKQLVLWLLMRISPTPGGSGVAEYSFAQLLQDFSASATLLISIAFLWRLISYFPYLIIGSFLLPRWLKKKAREN